MSIVLDSDWDHRGGDGFAKVGNKGPENCGQCPTGSIPAVKGSLLDRRPIGTFKMSYPVIRSGPRQRVFYMEPTCRRISKRPSHFGHVLVVSARATPRVSARSARASANAISGAAKLSLAFKLHPHLTELGCACNTAVAESYHQTHHVHRSRCLPRGDHVCGG